METNEDEKEKKDKSGKKDPIENLITPGIFARDREKAREAGVKSGESRRKKRLVTDYMKELFEAEMEVKYPGQKEKITALGAEHVAVSMMNQILKGNVHAYNSASERVEGPVIKKTSFVGQNGEDMAPIMLNVNAVKSTDKKDEAKEGE